MHDLPPALKDSLQMALLQRHEWAELQKAAKQDPLEKAYYKQESLNAKYLWETLQGA